MPTLTIRNVPDQVVAALKALAKANGRSMEQEIRELLASAALDRKAVCDLIEASWKRQKRPIRAEEVLEWIAEGRRRTP
jgi:plasmid stability protein